MYERNGQLDYDCMHGDGEELDLANTNLHDISKPLLQSLPTTPD
jgi:hypothetical protein